MIPPPVAGGARGQERAYVYLLRSRLGESDYVGWTTNPLRRLVEHNERRAGFTRRKVPWQLIGFEAYQTVEAAKARERTLKHNSRMLSLFKKRMLNRMACGHPRQVGG